MLFLKDYEDKRFCMAFTCFYYDQLQLLFYIRTFIFVNVLLTFVCKDNEFSKDEEVQEKQSQNKNL